MALAREAVLLLLLEVKVAPLALEVLLLEVLLLGVKLAPLALEVLLLAVVKAVLVRLSLGYPWKVTIIGLRRLWEFTLQNIMKESVGERLRNEQKMMGSERIEIRICTVGLVNIRYVYLNDANWFVFVQCFFNFCSENVNVEARVKRKKEPTVDFNKQTGRQHLTLA